MSTRPKRSRRTPAVDAKTIQVLRARVEAASRGATDDQLRMIWPPWNNLPPTMLPEERCRILTGFGIERNPERRQHLDRLRKTYEYLPLDSNTYNRALQACAVWANLVRFYIDTVENCGDQTQPTWSYRHADADDTFSIAIVRAVREIELTKPCMLKSESPILADIALLEERYGDYSDARLKALKSLEHLLYKIPNIRTGHRLPLDEQAIGLPYPPDDVPHYLYIARLDALGICSQERFAEFMRNDFLKLTRDQQQQFYLFRLQPHYGNEPYAALLIWITDNLPVFKRFKWLWKDILQAAAEKGIEHPQSTQALKQWASKHHLAGKLQRGSPGYGNRNVPKSSCLLSPPPAFGEILRN